MGKNLRFEGAAGLRDILDALPGKLGRQKVGEILRKAEKPLIAAAKAKAPKGNGDLIKSIGGIAGRGGGRGEQRYVGPRRGGANKGYAGHLVEYGTGPRKQKDGTNTGSMPAQPYMRPAYEETKDQIVQIISDEVAAVIADGFKAATRNK